MILKWGGAVWKLKSDSGFFEFLRQRGVSKKLVLLLVLGIVLLLVGSGSEKSSEKAEQTKDAESELVAMCSSLSGVGECRVMMSYGEDGAVYAVAVLCEGAESDAVKERIYELVGSLYGIGTNRIAVLKISG